VFRELLERRIFDEPPALVLLPGGSTNMNAADVGMRGKLEHALRRLAAWAGSGEGQPERVKRPILCARGGVGGEAAYGMFFGAGSIIRGIEYYHEQIHSRGIANEIGPGIAMLRTLWGLFRRDPRFSSPTAMRIGLDEQPVRPAGEVHLLLITSLERLFLGMRPYWGTEPAPLHCTWIERPARRLLREFAFLARGKPRPTTAPENGYFSHNAGQVRLWFDGSFTLDGEMYQASSDTGPVTVSNGGDLEFIRFDG
jgi:hypothetical protein